MTCRISWVITGGKKYIYECFNKYKPLSIIRGKINRSFPHPHPHTHTNDVPTKKLHVNGAWWVGALTCDKCVLSDKLILHRLHSDIKKKKREFR
jgi:hypothetical protein